MLNPELVYNDIFGWSPSIIMIIGLYGLIHTAAIDIFVVAHTFACKAQVEILLYELFNAGFFT
jgi:hypothetical protein